MARATPCWFALPCLVSDEGVSVFELDGRWIVERVDHLIADAEASAEGAVPLHGEHHTSKHDTFEEAVAALGDAPVRPMSIWQLVRLPPRRGTRAVTARLLPTESGRWRVLRLDAEIGGDAPAHFHPASSDGPFTLAEAMRRAVELVELADQVPPPPPCPCLDQAGGSVGPG